jgi:hypothetical protein
MAVILRNLYGFLKEVQVVTGKIPGRWIKLEPIVHEVKANSLNAGSTLTMEKQTVVNEAFVIPFWYGAVNGTKGAFNVDVNIVGPDEKPIVKFDSLILSMESDKPVITNPVIVVPEGKKYRVEITNNTGSAVSNVILQAWGFRMEKEAFRAG